MIWEQSSFKSQEMDLFAQSAGSDIYTSRDVSAVGSAIFIIFSLFVLIITRY